MAADKVGKSVRGHVRLWRVDEASGLMVPVASQKNQILLSWGHIAARQIGYRPQANRPSYHISSMYVEYQNVASEGAPAEAPSVERDLDIGYYSALSETLDKDFLRVPLRLEPALGVSAVTEADYPGFFTEGEDGNLLTFFAQTSGVTGEHGKDFSAAAGSTVYSAALVATPGTDWQQDVLFSHITFETENQVTKEASSQIGITWDIAFE